MMAVLGDVDRPELLYRPFAPSVPKALKGGSLFSAIAKSDILLHHPFQSFSPIEDLLREAARDRMCWPSSKRFTAPAQTPPSSARWSTLLVRVKR